MMVRLPTRVVPPESAGVHFSLGANTAVVNRVPPSAKPAYAG